MKRFSLKFLLTTVTVIAMSVGLTVNWYRTGSRQRENVLELVLTGGFVEKSPAVSLSQRVHVIYNGDLEWAKTEKRYQLRRDCFDEKAKTRGLSGWIRKRFGRNFVESPIAIEIDCYKFGRSTLPADLVDQIKKLPSVRQIWMADRTGQAMGNDDPEVGPTNRYLENLFPDLIVASPQRNAGNL